MTLGVFDTLVDGDRSAQVKCWDSALKVYQKGDEVPRFETLDTYTIVLPSYCDAEFALIAKGKFHGFTNEVRNTWEPYISKWGFYTELSVDQDTQSPIFKALRALVKEFDKGVEG